MGLFSSVKKFVASVQNAVEDTVIEGTGVYSKEQHERLKAIRADMQREWIGEDEEVDDDEE